MSSLYDVTIDEVVAGAVNAGQARVFTQMPGKIVSYDPTTQTCTVQPMIKVPIFDPLTDEQGESETLPQLSNVPVGWFRGGGFNISWPLMPGDEVTVEWQYLATGQWRTSGELSEPLDIRRHNIGSALVRPDACSLSKILLNPTLFPGALVIGKDGDPTSSIRISEAMVICGGAVPLSVAMALATVQAITALQAQITALQAALMTLTTLNTTFVAPGNVALVDPTGVALVAVGTASAAVITPQTAAVTAATPLIPSLITMGQ